MKILFLEDVLPTARAGDIKDVKTGFARNYLIPNKLAIFATESAKKVLAENIKQKEQKNQKIIAELESTKKNIELLDLKIGSKVGEDGKLFGSVNSSSISSELSKEGIEIDKKYIWD